MITLAASARAAEQAPFLLGADVSLAAKLEKEGVVYKDGGQPKDIFAIFRAHGANCIRLRLFVHPDGKGGVVNDLPYTVALAKRVKAAGLLFCLDFHYSDTWADPGHQTIPAEWRDLPFPQLVDRVRDYTAQTIRAFREAGAMPEIVQIGNEITNGMMWPAGALDDKSVPEAQRFDRFATLLRAGAEGARLGAQGTAMPRLMLHVDEGANRGKSQWFFENLSRKGVPFDMIGLSYYPAWKGTLEGLRENLDYLARTYHKPVAVVETDYLNADPPWLQPEKRRYYKFPLTPAGQAEFLRALIQTVRETLGGLGAGVLWWNAESVPDPKPEGWYGGNSAMFDKDGNALPVFGTFSK